MKEGVDIALRLGPLADSSLKLHHLGQSTRLLVASPAYLAAHGKPERPEDLTAHNVIRMSNVAGSDVLALTGPDGRAHSISVRSDLRVDHGLAAREGFRAGRGIGPAHRWLVHDLIESGELEPLLQGYSLPSTPLNMLIVPERAKVTRVRLLIDYLVDEISRLPGIA